LGPQPSHLRRRGEEGVQGQGARSGRGSRERKTSKGEAAYLLGDEKAFKTERNGVLLFTIGARSRQRRTLTSRVRARFGGAFEDAWKEAVGYVGSFEKKMLLSADEFFGEVYRPRRDQLAEKWTVASAGSA
jgi:hypothetical protein